MTTYQQTAKEKEVNKTPDIEWNRTHIIKILIGTGIGGLLEFYSFALVAYFESQLKSAFFPTIHGDYDSLLVEFALYGISITILIHKLHIFIFIL